MSLDLERLVVDWVRDNYKVDDVFSDDEIEEYAIDRFDMVSGDEIEDQARNLGMIYKEDVTNPEIIELARELGMVFPEEKDE
jgi:hypothetical protein